MAKHKITATIQWELETGDADILKSAHEQLEKMLPAYVSGRILKLDSLKHRRNRKIIAEFSLEEVLPFIVNDDKRREYKVGDKTYQVRMNSHRYFVFRASPKCASCGLEGVKFVLEQHPNDKSPHFNMYAVEDGDLVLMTKDHIHAKSYGGEDRHSNYQTMCATCNNLKGNANLTLEGIAELRVIYNENKRILTKKKLNELLSESRKRLAVPRSGKKYQTEERQGEIVINCDIVIVRHNGVLQGFSVYDDKSHSGSEQVACLKKGTILKPIGRDGKKIRIEFNDAEFLVFQGLAD